VLLERAFGVIVARRLREYQAVHGLSDVSVARLARVSQSYWYRVRSDDRVSAGDRLMCGLAVAHPDLLRAAIDEVQVMKRDELARLRAGDAAGAGVAV